MNLLNSSKLLAPAGLLNNIPLLVTIIVLFVVIAVGLILYFLVFKNKINELIAKNKAKREEARKQKEESKSLASNVFKNKDKVEVKEDNVDSTLTAAKYTNKTLVSNKEDLKGKFQENKQEIKSDAEIKDMTNFMGQFQGKTVVDAKKAAANTTKPDISDDLINSKTGDSYMGQFKNPAPAPDPKAKKEEDKKDFCWQCSCRWR